MDFISHKQDILGRPGRKVYDMRPRPRAGRGGASFPWSKCALGYVLNPDGDAPTKVRILTGEIDRIGVDQTDLTVADGQIIFVRRAIADDTTTVMAAATVPANDPDYKYYRLYKVTVTDEIASIQAIYRPFDIETAEVLLPEPGADGQLLQSNGTAWTTGWGRMKAIT